MPEIKVCPVCKIPKSHDDYYRSYRKERNTFRLSHSCKDCDKASSKIRVVEKKKADKGAVLEAGRIARKLAIDNLYDGYVAQQAAKSTELSIKEVREVPGLLDVFKTKILLNRKIKEYGSKK